MTFEEYWGDKGEKWNGKLDIKKFAKEIWDESQKQNKINTKELTVIYETTTGVQRDFNTTSFMDWIECAKATGILLT